LDLRLLASLAVTGVVLWFVLRFWAGGAGEVQGVLARAHWERFPVAWLASVAGLGFAVQRWRFVLAAMDCGIPFRRAAYSILAVWAPAVLTPSRAAELGRAWLIRDRVPSWSGAGSVLAEKLTDVFSLAVLAALGAALDGRWTRLAAIGAVISATATFFFYLFRTDSLLEHRWLRRFGPRLQLLREPFRALLLRPRRAVQVLACSLANWLCSFAIVLSLLHTFGAPFRFEALLAQWPMALFIGMVPVTLQGMGTRDAAFLQLASASSPETPAAALLAASLGYALLATWQWALVGLPFLFHALLRSRRRAR
jgi:uncharacterized protein (TIRG00374 family)